MNNRYSPSNSNNSDLNNQETSKTESTQNNLDFENQITPVFSVVQRFYGMPVVRIVDENSITPGLPEVMRPKPDEFYGIIRSQLPLSEKNQYALENHLICKESVSNYTRKLFSRKGPEIEIMKAYAIETFLKQQFVPFLESSKKRALKADKMLTSSLEALKDIAQNDKVQAQSNIDQVIRRVRRSCQMLNIATRKLNLEGDTILGLALNANIHSKQTNVNLPNVQNLTSSINDPISNPVAHLLDQNPPQTQYFQDLNQASLEAERVEKASALFKSIISKFNGLSNDKALEGLTEEVLNQKLNQLTEEQLSSLIAMEESGGEPAVISYNSTTNLLTICDSSLETPEKRVGLTYLEALKMAEKMGITMLDSSDYGQLQSVYTTDKLTWNWLKSPEALTKERKAYAAKTLVSKLHINPLSINKSGKNGGFRGKLVI